MSEKEKKILETFGKVIPNLSDMEKEKLLSFGEGMAFMKGKQKAEESNQSEFCANQEEVRKVMDEKWFYGGLLAGAIVGLVIWSYLKATGKVY